MTPDQAKEALESICRRAIDRLGEPACDVRMVARAMEQTARIILADISDDRRVDNANACDTVR